MCDCEEFDRELTSNSGIVFAKYTCIKCGKTYEQLIGETWKPKGKELKEWRVD